MCHETAICFDVVGSFSQEIRILDDEITPEMVVDKLNRGEYLTTLEVSHPDLKPAPRMIVGFDDEGNEFDVAEILSQTADEENTYMRFQIDVTEE